MLLDLTKPRDAHIDERLHKEIMIWLSTVRPNGHPHLVPVWFLWDGETILIFSQPKTQKVRNLQHNLNVMLALDTARLGGDIVMIEGKAELLKEPTTAIMSPEYAEKYKERMARLRMNPEAMARDYSVAIRITPTKFLGHGE